MQARGKVLTEDTIVYVTVTDQDGQQVRQRYAVGAHTHDFANGVCTLCPMTEPKHVQGKSE